MADTRLQKKIGVGRHLSAIKRHRQSLKRRARNKHVINTMRTILKKARATVGEEDKEKAISLTKAAVAYLHKAASKGVIPKRKASRLSSRLSRHCNAIG